MSRSRRAPIATQGYGGKWRKCAKKLANKRVRGARIPKNGNNYKKIFNSWDIVDWKFSEDKNHPRYGKK